jgi:steroid delta-isomerase-like uncharacterized protein
MGVESNKALVRRFVTEVWNEGNLTLADELVHQAYDIPEVGRGSEAVKRVVTVFRTAFPDMNWSIENLVAEGEWVAVRLMLHGTHRGEFRGIAPTGRRVTMQEMVFWRIVDGRLHTIWVQADALGLREQLRAIPPG